MANSVVKSAFIEAMISSGRTIEEAEQDWLQYLEDMADYRAHKYGNGYVSDQEFWGTPDEIEYDLDMEARAKWVNEAPHTDGKRADREKDWDEIPF